MCSKCQVHSSRLISWCLKLLEKCGHNVNMRNKMLILFWEKWRRVWRHARVWITLLCCYHQSNTMILVLWSQTPQARTQKKIFSTFGNWPRLFMFTTDDTDRMWRCVATLASSTFCWNIIFADLEKFLWKLDGESHQNNQIKQYQASSFMLHAGVLVMSSEPDIARVSGQWIVLPADM